MKNLICPVSSERVNENVVRLTALQVVFLLGAFLLVPNIYIPAFLAIDFYIRAFSGARYSLLSWISNQVSIGLNIDVEPIDKAPKIFAARIGFLFSIAITLLFLFGLTAPAIIVASVLVIFAFLECGVNFCAGCWVYTYLVLPFYNNK